MKPNPHLDFFEKMLPQHVSRALGDRLTARRQKKSAPSKLAPPDQEESPAHEAAESPEAEAQEEEGLPGASQEDVGQSAIETNTQGDGAPRKVYMMPSEKYEKRAKPKHLPPLKPKVIGR